MSRLWLSIAGFALVFAGLLQTAAAAPDVQGSCQFVLGFKTLHDLIPNVVGNCLTDVQYAANGDALQTTTNGLMVWRKADNYTAFTDGYRTWVNGPLGLQERLNTQRFAWEKAATVDKTQVIEFVPPQTTAKQASGECFALSAAATRSDAWRCMVDNSIYDPCFGSQGSSKVVCVDNPLDSNTYVTLNLTKPLPAPSPVTETHPWFLQLADGTVCGFLTGATGGVDGERINYGCSDGWVVVGLPQKDTVWTVHEVLLGPLSESGVPEVKESAIANIAIAWE